MRLINADALIDDIKNNLWDWETVDGITATTVLKQTISDIGNQPIIEERKTGKWIWETKHYKDDEQEYYYYEEHCSNCGVKRKIGWGYANFCQNCGADMRGNDNG